MKNKEKKQKKKIKSVPPEIINNVDEQTLFKVLMSTWTAY